MSAREARMDGAWTPGRGGRVECEKEEEEDEEEEKEEESNSDDEEEKSE